jgi:hypothetical protein
MFKRASVGMAAFLLILGSAWSTANAQTKTKAAEAAKVVEGDLVSLDVKKLTAVVKTDGGNQTIALAKDVSVVGPRDGVRRDGLEDEQLDKGAKIRVTMATGGKTAKEIKILTPAPVAATPPAATKTGSAAPKTKTGAKAAAKVATDDIKGPSGKIVKVDATAMKFTIADSVGKRTEFAFDGDTLFIGPRGGQGEKNGKDDRFVVGAPVKIVLGISGKAVKEVHLPMRSAIEK